jgi:alpha-ribazole phosphatase
MEIYLIRHTSPDIGIDVCYGQTDINVGPLFEKEAVSVKNRLDISEPIAVYSSPLKRCARLASMLSTDDFKLDDRLLEMNFGDFEGQKWTQIDRTLFSEWADDFVNNAPPGGENFLSLYNRSLAFLKDPQIQKHKTIVVVTHAGVIRCLIGHVLGLPLENVFRFQIYFGSISKIDLGKEINRVMFINR